MCRGSTNGEDVYIVNVDGFPGNIEKLANPRWIENHGGIPVDACIGAEIEWLIGQGVVTLGCCCGHGRAGEINEWENAYGKWKGYHEPPQTLLAEESVELARSLGYRPFPYLYADGEQGGVWNMYLKTGCITKEDCEKWARGDYE
jgi:hypothetical protein